MRAEPLFGNAFYTFIIARIPRSVKKKSSYKTRLGKTIVMANAIAKIV